MTVDDESSIYVGGLPYDITEDSLRRVFYEYGAVVAVKIINDRSVGGKCYGFVTFANPRSAVQAIKEMDGKTLDGRVIKVNEVRTRGGRSNFNNQSARHDLERRNDGDRGRDRGRDDNYDRHRHRERFHDHGQNRERGHDHAKDRYLDGERFRDYDRHMDDFEQERGRKRGRGYEKDSDKNTEQQRDNNHHNSEDYDKQQQFPLMDRSRFEDNRSRELSLESLNDDQYQVENNLAVSNQKLEDLRKEISQMEELVADKQEFVSKLQDKYKKLEDSLLAAKKVTSHRHMLLTRLNKCFLQMKDYDDRFKKSEQELQRLVDSTMKELGNEGGSAGDGIATKGKGLA